MKKGNNEALAVHSYERDSENRVIVNMTVNDDIDFLSVFSRGESPVISTDVADFIESSTASISPKEPLTLRIRSGYIDEEEQPVYRKALKAYYREKSTANNREIRRNNFIALILLLSGVLVLALSIFISYVVHSAIWSEVIDVVAWVLLWECVDISVFKNIELRFRKKRYNSYISMKVEYCR